jgi:hypothetical protein
MTGQSAASGGHFAQLIDLRYPQGDCVGSQLVSTFSIYDREGTKHAPGRTTLTAYGKSWQLSDADASALGAAWHTWTRRNVPPQSPCGLPTSRLLLTE